MDDKASGMTINSVCLCIHVLSQILTGKEGKLVNGTKERKRFRRQNAATLPVAGTCGGFTVYRFKEGALVHPIQGNHVAGVGIQPRNVQAESVSRQTEVLALCDILQVCYLNDKAVKLPTHGAPRHIEAVPCYVRDGEVHHHRPQLFW